MHARSWKYLLLFTALSFRPAADNIQTLYKKGMDQTKLGKYEESNKYLFQALQIQPHSQILFWISYNFAHLQKIDSCSKYLELAKHTSPQPMPADYNQYTAKLSAWLQDRRSGNTKYDGLLNKKKDDQTTDKNDPSKWGTNEENTKMQLKKFYGAPLDITPPPHDSLIGLKLKK